MLVGQPTFEHAWADAAGTQVDVIRLTIDSSVSGRSTDLDGLVRDPERDDTYYLGRPPQPVPGAPGRAWHRHQLAKAAAEAARHLDRAHDGIDLVHGHFSASGDLLAAMAASIEAPFVITEHSTSFSGMNPDNQTSRRGLARARRVCEQAAVVLPVSDQLRTAMEQHGIHANYRVLPNPYDSRVFGPPEVLPPAEPIELVSVARLARVKGHDLLIDAVARLRPRHPSLRLTIVGDGEARDDLTGHARARSVDDIVTFAGKLRPAEVAERLRSAHLFVLATRWENLSVAVLEACAAGLPAIATRVGGLAEIEARGLTLIEPGDLESLVRHLDAALDDLPDLATRRAWADDTREHYGLDGIGRRLAAAYEDVLGT
jgi:glycosyltransferase involved in cell wall biosynthesis